MAEDGSEGGTKEARGGPTSVTTDERWDLRRLTVAEIILLGAAVTRGIWRADNLEEAAGILTARLRDTLWDPDSDRSAVVLARFYRTISFRDLEPGLQEFAASAGRMGPSGPPEPDTKCLTLMGTVGDEPAWNSRHHSVSHRAIPLRSPEVVNRLPMVSRLISDLGMSVRALVAGRPSLEGLEHLEDGRVFHVQHAQRSPSIPDQDGFVTPYGVRSAIGFGGPLESGDLWAIVLFTRVEITPSLARLFRFLSTDVRIAMRPVLTRRFFAA